MSIEGEDTYLSLKYDPGEGKNWELLIVEPEPSEWMWETPEAMKAASPEILEAAKNKVIDDWLEAFTSLRESEAANAPVEDEGDSAEPVE